MVSCRSCGRNIASGTIRCSKCSSPFHLSCSHRYKISPEGVFNVCCGPVNSVFPGNGTFHMRTRNKRRRQQANKIANDNNIHNIITRNSSKIVGYSTTVTNEENDNMQYRKLQKVEQTMTVNDKPIIDESNNCNEIIQDGFNETETETETLTLYDNNESEEIIIESENIIEHNQAELEIIDINETNEKNNKITLETVWKGISSLQSSISNISNSLDTVSTQLNTFDPRINELESTLNTIKAKTSNFENVQNDVSGLKNELERIAKELEEIKSNQSEKELDFSTVIMEIKLRDYKSKNLLIYNVPEDNLRISQDYSTLEDINKFNALVAARDTSRAREILENVPNVDLEDLQTRRLGRMNPNICRPLRVTLQRREDVITIMKNKHLINSQYSVKTDLTKLQQQKIRDLKEELDKINNPDNPTMTIKFINGEPQIVPIRRNNLKNE